MKYASPYELKKALKRIGYDLEGLQVTQVKDDKRYEYLIAPLDTSAVYDPATGGFRTTSSNMHLMALLNELTDVLKNTNVAVGSLDKR